MGKFKKGDLVYWTINYRPKIGLRENDFIYLGVYLTVWGKSHYKVKYTGYFSKGASSTFNEAPYIRVGRKELKKVDKCLLDFKDWCNDR